MQIIERSVSINGRSIFDLEEFLSRPLFAHLATAGETGPRHSPVWFHWDGQYVWIIGGLTFPKNIAMQPACALGIVDFSCATGLVHHVGMRGKAAILPFDSLTVQTIYGKYFGNAPEDWDKRFESSWNGKHPVPLIRFEPETVVIRDQSYHAPASICYEK
jgi:hypothetical protein